MNICDIESLAPLPPLQAPSIEPQGSLAQEFSLDKETPELFYEKLLEGFALEALRQMQQQEEALKKAMKRGHH